MAGRWARLPLALAGTCLALALAWLRADLIRAPRHSRPLSTRPLSTRRTRTLGHNAGLATKLRVTSPTLECKPPIPGKRKRSGLAVTTGLANPPIRRSLTTAPRRGDIAGARRLALEAQLTTTHQPGSAGTSRSTSPGGRPPGTSRSAGPGGRPPGTSRNRAGTGP